MRLTIENTICLVVDYQEKLVPAIKKNEKLIENSVKLLQSLRLLSVPCIVTQQYTKGLGETIEEIKEVVGIDCPTMEKISFSGYLNQAIKEKIKESGRKNIILCGVEAHVCVLQTLIDLQNDGYQTILITDCIGSRKEKDRMGAITRATWEGAMIITYESLVFELMQQGGTDLFRQIMTIVK